MQPQIRLPLNPFQVIPNGIKSFFNQKIAANTQEPIMVVPVNGPNRMFSFIHFLNNVSNDTNTLQVGLLVIAVKVDPVGVISIEGSSNAAVVTSPFAPLGINFDISDPSKIIVLADNIGSIIPWTFNIQTVVNETVVIP